MLGFYYVYQTVRSLAAHGNTETRAHSNANLIVSWEKHLWLYHEQSIQQAFLGAEWFIRTMNIYYGTLHFVITTGLLVWLQHHGVCRLGPDHPPESEPVRVPQFWPSPSD